MAKAATGKPKSMTKSEMAANLAETTGISKKQVVGLFAALSDLAYKQAKNSFVIPGIGKLELREKPAKTMIMPFGPNKGQEVTVPTKKVLKFKVAKAAKDAILGAKK